MGAAIKAIVFDLDNTLYDEDQYFNAVHRKFAKRIKVNATSLMKTYQDIKSGSNDIFGDILKYHHLYTVPLQEEYFRLYKTVDAMLALYDDAKRVVTMLQEKGYTLGIITNGIIEAQKNKVRCLGIEKYFHSIIFAREFGKEYEKPHATAFKHFLRLFNLSAAECISVGDTYKTDIVGAKQVGMQTMLLQREKHGLPPKRDAYIDYLGRDLYLLQSLLI